jgi:hypothetical protein
MSRQLTNNHTHTHSHTHTRTHTHTHTCMYVHTHLHVTRTSRLHEYTDPWPGFVNKVPPHGRTNAHEREQQSGALCVCVKHEWDLRGLICHITPHQHTTHTHTHTHIHTHTPRRTVTMVLVLSEMYADYTHDNNHIHTQQCVSGWGDIANNSHQYTLQPHTTINSP